MKTEERQRARRQIEAGAFQLARQVCLVLAMWGLGQNVPGQGWNVEVVGQIGGECRAVFVAGNYAYIGEGPNLRILDVSNASSPVALGRVLLPDIVRGVYVSGNMAYVADGYGGLRIIAVTNPSSPQLRGSYDTLGYARGVFVSGSVAYVADSGSGLQMIDIANPSSPTLLGCFDTPGGADGVFVSGSVAYVADGASGLWILRYTGPPPSSARPPWRVYR